MAESKAQNISSQLWAIANDLRGTMDASSFQRLHSSIFIL